MAFDFMDPIFLIYMTSALQRYATLFWGVLFELGSMPIKLCVISKFLLFVDAIYKGLIYTHSSFIQDSIHAAK